MTTLEGTDTLTVTANGLDFECLVWGEPTADPLLCLHGFPDDPTTFASVAAGLDRRIIAPYMRGYAPTGAAPDGRYDPVALGDDAVALARALGTREVFGHDWGAVAVYAAIAGYDHFGRVAIAAVPPNFFARLFDHPRQVLRSWYMWVSLFPYAERAVRARDFALLELLWSMWSPGWKYPRERIAHVKSTFEEKDTVTHALAYYRQMVNRFVDSLADDPLERRVFETPALVLTGAEDGCIATELYNDVHEDFKTARVARVREAGHFLHCERPGAVADELENFLD